MVIFEAEFFRANLHGGDIRCMLVNRIVYEVVVGRVLGISVTDTVIGICLNGASALVIVVNRYFIITFCIQSSDITSCL